MLDTGKEAFTGDNSFLESAADQAMPRTYQLLTLFKHELDKSIVFNPSFILVAEGIAHAPMIKSGKQYLQSTVSLLKISPMNYSVVNDIHSYKIANKKFYRVDLELTDFYGTIKQSFIAAKFGDYALAIILTGITDKDVQKLEGFISRLDFKKKFKDKLD